MPTSASGSDWLKPSTILSIVMCLGTFAAMWVSLNQRITENQTNIANLSNRLSEHKTEEAQRLDRIEAKLDRLIERSE